MTADPRIQALSLAAFNDSMDTLEGLRRAHRLVASRLRAVYAMNDRQSTSRTLDRGRGSCSQRMAVLEAASRSAGVPTRVQGFVVDGSFWYQRFPRMKWLVPRNVVLPWPEFLVDGGWLSFTDLFGSGCLVNGAGFTNAPGQTLFEATETMRVSWKGGDGCDLSGYVRADLGYYDSRDDLFDAVGQTLCAPARVSAALLLSRRASVQ